MFAFQQILNSSPQIKSYFEHNATSTQQYIKLATQLLLESVRFRFKLLANQVQENVNKQQKSVNKEQIETQFVNKKSPKLSNNTHYNVAYIKHNRFLSPTQKRQVTPKVTQIIPVSPEKVFIYGKPKVKLDNNFGCVLHQQNCQQYAQDQPQYDEKDQKQNQPQSEFQQMNYTQQLPRQYQEYLSPKNKMKKKGLKNSNRVNQTVGMIKSPKNKNSSINYNQMTSPKGLSNKHLQGQNYSNVQSKIKQLVQRDKKNRQIQKQVQKQSQKIRDLEQKQNKLFMMQKYQQGLLNREGQIDQNHQNEIWKITTTQSPQKIINNQCSQLQSQSSQSIVDLHGHSGQQSRIECYECQIERLRRRKQKAKRAIQQIQKQEIKRSKILGSIARNSQINKQKGFSRSSDNSITLH